MTLARRFATLAAALSAMCLLVTAPPAAGRTKLELAIAALSGRVLTEPELNKIYSGRTWHWKTGAAYFKPNQRFVAWVKGGAETTYAEGSWSVSNNGQMCIRATWHSLSADTKTFTCYVHRTGDAIYQREVPRGNWYLFSHIPPRAGDEIRRIENGDHVSAAYAKAKRYVIKHRRANTRHTPRRGSKNPR